MGSRDKISTHIYTRRTRASIFREIEPGAGKTHLYRESGLMACFPVGGKSEENNDGYAGNFARDSEEHRVEEGPQARQGEGNERRPVHEGRQPAPPDDRLGRILRDPRQAPPRGLRVGRLDEDHEEGQEVALFAAWGGPPARRP